MFCPNCGANLPEGSKFCTECGANIAPAPTAQPQGGYPPQPTQPQGGYPGAAAPTGAPGAYPPPQQPQPQAPAVGSVNNNPYSYGGQTAPADNAAPPKKSKALPIVLIVIAVLLAVLVLLVAVFKVFDKDPVITDTTATTTISEPTQEATTEPDNQTTEAVQTTAAEPTTVLAETTAPDDSFTDAQVTEMLEKMKGYWNSDDESTVLSITREDDGRYLFQLGFWYSEVVMAGYLQQPVKGDPNGVVSIWMYYDGYDSEEGFSMPSQDGAEQFDLSGLSSGLLRWQNGGNWYEYHYAGATMEEAAPPM